MARLRLLQSIQSVFSQHPRLQTRWARAAIVVALCALVVSTVGAGLLLVHITNASGTGTVYVNNGPSGSDSNDCLSAAAPCLTISAALGKVASGGTVIIAANTYVGGFTIGQDVTLQGAGTEQTIIYGNGGSGPGIDISSGTVTLSDLTVMGVSNNGNGGGIANSGALTLSNVVVSDNFALNGGGIENTGTLTLNNSIVSDNAGGGSGGGGIDNSGTLTLTNTFVSHNTANAGSGLGGGGIENSGTLSVTSSTINGNAAPGSNGGGIQNASGSLSVISSTFSGNSATHGGGIYSGGTATIANSTFSGNSASDDGGAIVSTATLTLVNSTISGNSASTDGGGMATIFSTPTLINSTISGNSAGLTGVGGGIDGKAALDNTVVAGNTSNGSPLDCNSTLSDATTSHGNNFIGAASSCGLTDGQNGDHVGTPTSKLDAQLNGLAANGGSTLTMQPASTSPLLGAGYGPTCTSTGATGVNDLDQRGYHRQTSSRSGVCDIGAYDHEPQPAPIDLTGSGLKHYVNNGPTGDDSNSCLEPLSPCLTIGAALAKAVAGGTISIAPGLYPGGVLINDVNVTLQGAGPEQTIIFGGGPAIFVGNGSETLSDLTITSWSSSGGGVDNNGGLTLSNVVVSDNGNNDGGGGIFNTGGMTVNNSVLSHNFADGTGGGAIWNLAGGVTLNNTIVSHNAATFEGGGGIFNLSASLTVTGSILSDNSTPGGGYGGGIYNQGGSTLTISNSTLSGNSGLRGGGIDNSGGGDNATILSSTISGNYGGSGAGNCGGDGGGIYSGGGSITLTNSTLSGNCAAKGGGIYSGGGSATLTNSTLSSNSSDTSGYAGGIHGSAALDNTVIAGNTSNGSSFDCDSTLSDATSGHGNNFIAVANSCGLSNGSNGDQVGSAGSPLVAKLGGLAANGGPTLTMQPPSGSPLSGAGYGATCLSTGSTGVNDLDQRSYPRRTALTNNCTVGAYDTSTAAATTTTLTTLPSTGNTIFGQNLTLDASVAPSSGSGPALTGTVTFLDGTTPLGSPVTLDGSGKASLSVSSLAVGSHTLSVQYNGDTNYADSGSNPLDWQVNQISTQTTLGASPTTSVFGQSVTLSATVSVVSPGTGTPGGTVTFYDGGTQLGSPQTLDVSGKASLTVSNLALGSHTLSATYNGATDYAGSSTTSGASVQVNQAQTTTSLSVAPSSSILGQGVTLAATVSVVSPGSGTPSGTVTFYDGGTQLGTPQTLDPSGKASLSVSNLALGGHTLTAAYNGATDYAGSTSNGSGAQVNKIGTQTTLVASLVKSTFGQTEVLSATVSAVTPGTGTPTGTVTFFNGTMQLGSPVPLLANGSVAIAGLTATGFTVGNYTLTAQYNGDSTDATSSGTTTISVSQVSTATTLVVAPTSSVQGQQVTLSATVGASAAGAGTPTGTVTFFDGSAQLGSPVTLDSNGKASFATSSLALGTHSITAQYSGDTNDAASGATGYVIVSPSAPPPVGASDGYVRFVQATGYSSLDIEIDGQVVFPNVPQQAVQPYSPIAAGTHTVTVLVPSGGSTQLLSQSITVTAGQYQTLLLSGAGGAGSGKLVAIVDNLSVASGQASVRVYNAQASTGLSYTATDQPSGNVSGSSRANVGTSANVGTLLRGGVALAPQIPAVAADTSVSALSAGASFSVSAPGTLSLALTPTGGTTQTDLLQVGALQVYSIFIFDPSPNVSGTVGNTTAPGVPQGLPQTGIGPSSAPWLVALLLALLALLGLGGGAWYLGLGRAGQGAGKSAMITMVSRLEGTPLGGLSRLGSWLRRRLGR